MGRVQVHVLIAQPVYFDLNSVASSRKLVSITRRKDKYTATMTKMDSECSPYSEVRQFGHHLFEVRKYSGVLKFMHFSNPKL